MLERRSRLLYIDDDEALARLVGKACSRRGFEMVHAGNSTDGLSYVDQGDIDVIALDHFLPTGTGLDFLADLKKRERAPPAVYVTASSEMAVAVNALRAGAADYVTKTVGDEFLELLFSAINQALERARLTAEKEQAEQEVREARDRAEVLLREVNHRVANSLSLVATLVRMQSSVLVDQNAIDALAETQARIAAIAGVHQRLYTSAEVGWVAIDDYLRGLVEELDASMETAGHRSFIASWPTRSRSAPIGPCRSASSLSSSSPTPSSTPTPTRCAAKLG